MTRRADADIVDGRQAVAVSEAQSAGAAEIHRIPLGYGATHAAIHAWRGGAWVTKLAPASYISIPAPEKTQIEKSVSKERVASMRTINDFCRVLFNN